MTHPIQEQPIPAHSIGIDVKNKRLIIAYCVSAVTIIVFLFIPWMITPAGSLNMAQMINVSINYVRIRSEIMQYMGGTHISIQLMNIFVFAHVVTFTVPILCLINIIITLRGNRSCKKIAVITFIINSVFWLAWIIIIALLHNETLTPLFFVLRMRGIKTMQDAIDVLSSLFSSYYGPSMDFIPYGVSLFLTPLLLFANIFIYPSKKRFIKNDTMINQSKRSDIMFCTKCGKKQENGVKFCVDCGAVINANQAASASKPADVFTVKNPEKKDKKKITIIVAIATSILLLIYMISSCFGSNGIVGVWDLDDGGPASLSYFGYERRIEFMRDKTVYKYNDRSTATWNTSGSRLTVKWLEWMQTFQFEVSGNKLKLTDTQGNTFIYKRVK